MLSICYENNSSSYELQKSLFLTPSTPVEVLQWTHVAVSVRNNSEVFPLIPAMRLSAADRCEWEEPPGAGVAFLCALMCFLASSFISNHLRLTSWVVL